MKHAIEILGSELKAIGLNYHYMEYKTDKVKYPYVVGEAMPSNYSFESNTTNSTFILNLWSRKDNLELLEIGEQIKYHFRNYTKVDDQGSIFVAYDNMTNVYTAVEGLYKLEIRLTVIYTEGA